MDNDGYKKVLPPPYAPSAYAPPKIDLEAAPDAQQAPPILADYEAYTTLSDFCNLCPMWPPDKEDSDFERTPSYQRFSVYNLCYGILFFAPLFAVSVYLLITLEEKCKHPRLNLYVAATLSIYWGTAAGFILEMVAGRKWLGRRAVYFKRWKNLVILYLGLFIGVSLSLWAADECAALQEVRGRAVGLGVQC